MEHDSKIKRIAVIGAGGVASYLIPVLIKSLQSTFLEIWDKDILEERNLDRQLFDPSMVGMNKAEALLKTCRSTLGKHKPEFFKRTSQLDSETNLIICICDNHPARNASLQKSDEIGIPVIIGANEYFDSEAYIYFPEWKNTQQDPRIRYPEIKTNKEGDPLGCQGKIQVVHPQLAIANQGAASKIMHLLWSWMVFENEGQYLPYELSSNLFKTESRRKCEDK